MSAPRCGNCKHFNLLFCSNSPYDLGYCHLHLGCMFESRPACRLYETPCINITIKCKEV